MLFCWTRLKTLKITYFRNHSDQGQISKQLCNICDIFTFFRAPENKDFPFFGPVGQPRPEPCPKPRPCRLGGFWGRELPGEGWGGQGKKEKKDAQNVGGGIEFRHQ